MIIDISDYIQFDFMKIAIWLIPLIFIIWCFTSSTGGYARTSYYKITRIPYSKMIRDAGYHGEFMASQRLKKFEKRGYKLLYNLYIPREEGKTTELDMLMISPKGVYVFEIKNYSGWIFGDEDDERWMQVLPKGRRSSHKTPFYNPVKQNKLHIKWLRVLLYKWQKENPTSIGDMDLKIPTFSIVTFADKATLRKITTYEHLDIITFRDIVSTIKRIEKKARHRLSETDMQRLYDELFEYTQTSDKVKKQHIKDIKRSRRRWW